MFYETNRKRAITRTTQPTLTDQAAARETDINIIVGRMLTTGTVQGNAQQPMYGDFTEVPNDLREAIERARSLHKHQMELPEPLRNIPIEQLLALTGDELVAKLKPPATNTEETK